MAFKEYVRSSQSRCEPMVGNSYLEITSEWPVSRPESALILVASFSEPDCESALIPHFPERQSQLGRGSSRHATSSHVTTCRPPC